MQHDCTQKTKEKIETTISLCVEGESKCASNHSTCDSMEKCRSKESQVSCHHTDNCTARFKWLYEIEDIFKCSKSKCHCNKIHRVINRSIEITVAKYDKCDTDEFEDFFDTCPRNNLHGSFTEIGK